MDTTALATIGLFADLSPQHLQVLASNLRPLHFDAGEMLISEGSETRAPLMIVKQGQLEVSRKDASGRSHPIATLDPPTVVGELEFLADVPSSASVRSASEVTGVLLPRARFRALFDKGEPAAYALALAIGRVVSERLAQTNHLLVKALQGRPELTRAIERAQLDVEALDTIDAELDALLEA